MRRQPLPVRFDLGVRLLAGLLQLLRALFSGPFLPRFHGLPKLLRQIVLRIQHVLGLEDDERAIHRPRAAKEVQIGAGCLEASDSEFAADVVECRRSGEAHCIDARPIVMLSLDQ